ncbi:neprilysin-4-like [Phlebotomus argentipes]|uniref:neprilysin-4-like n=1 Tax=Phlebotomus argentipes TaxID=94469 RepID=UPI002892C259|nr:neprilysin-4-like [Phlebotomus argentipes]
MRSIEWRYSDSGSYGDGCKLGVNRATGRLQWCPGSRCIRFLVLIPATLLSVILICVLLTHFDMPKGVSHNSHNFISITTNPQSNGQLLESQGSQKKCHMVRFRVHETLDIGENDLLKDIRTSFIPSESVIVPSKCLEDEGSANDDGEEHNPDATDSIDEVDVTIHTKDNAQISLYQRFKRNINDTLKETEQNLISMDKETNKTSQDLDKSSIGDFNSFWQEINASPAKIRENQAQMMRQYMDMNADPCEDFYQYACGNWEKMNPIPKDKSVYDTFEKLRESLDSVLRELLEAPVEHLTEKPTDAITLEPTVVLDNNQDLDAEARSTGVRKKRHHFNYFEDAGDEAEIKAKQLYGSCMNHDLLMEKGITPLLELLENLGGWPALDPQWNETNFDWLDLSAHLRLYNNDLLIMEWVGPDIKNSNENIVQFDQTSLGLPTRDYFILEANSVYLEAYREYMSKIIELLGANNDSAQKSSSEIVSFEIQLAKITMASEKRQNISLLYRRMNISELMESIPGIDFKRYLTIVLEREVGENETVVMYALDYMKQLVQLLSETQPRTISNYLIWRFAKHRTGNLDDRFQEVKQKFYFALYGREQSPPRWKNCVTQVNTIMGMALGAMFVRRYFDENSKEDTLLMTQELQESFREIINETDWMDLPTKHLAEAKVDAMSLKIGYPDYILSRSELNAKYIDMKIDPHNYFGNSLNVLKHLTRTEHAKLGQPVNKTAWNTAPAIVNAYYSRNKNQIMFPAGILQPPFYHKHFPRALNYGGIGVVIGHEVTHGFDDRGRLFDKNGNLFRWWSETAINNFQQRTNCLIAQYGNYTVSEVGIPVDGTNTQGENIADNGGMKQAFRAYKKWLGRPEMTSDELEDETLPGFGNYTNIQLFFLNFAQVWCGAMRKAAVEVKLKTAVHSPGKFRVIGTLSNSKDFQVAFNCSATSPMNRAQKCNVW